MLKVAQKPEEAGEGAGQLVVAQVPFVAVDGGAKGPAVDVRFAHIHRRINCDIHGSHTPGHNQIKI